MIAALIAALTGHRVRCTRERDTHEDLSTLWTRAGLVPQPEWRVPGSAFRIDFMMPVTVGLPIGIEVKIKGGHMAIARQVLDYALTGQFSALILITAKPLQGIPDHFMCQGRKVPVLVHVLSTTSF